MGYSIREYKDADGIQRAEIKIDIPGYPLEDIIIRGIQTNDIVAREISEFKNTGDKGGEDGIPDEEFEMWKTELLGKQLGAIIHALGITCSVFQHRDHHHTC